ncbi:MAG: protein BatD [Desulfobacterales bacterium]|nr:MAG: protein BatD [Desulfobacterales bacterium]
MRKIFLCLIFLFSVLTVPCAAYAEISLSLKIDRPQAVLTDSVQLVVSVAGSRDSGSDPLIQGLEDFTVTPGGTSSRIEFINGRMSSGIEYTYFIQPRKVGSFAIGPASVKIGGKTYASNRTILRVVQPAGDQGAADRRPIFLEAELSTPAVYVEEQAIYTLKLYLRKTVRDISLDLPDSENFAFKQLAKPTEYRSNRGGREYNVLEVRYALVPSKPGAFKVEPARMSMTVMEPRSRSRNSPFGDPLFRDPFSSLSTGRPLTVAGPTLQLDVRPLPEAGKPTDFSGLVGSFKMWSKLDPVSLKTGESATLTVSVSGRGNVNRIPDLKIAELDHIKVYADQPVLESTQDIEGLRGTKTMKWALVPEKDGRLEIPPVAVSFFDTQNHVYKTLRSTAYSLSVLPGKTEQISVAAANEASTVGEGTVKHAVEELGRDIFPIHTVMRDFRTAGRLQLEGWLLTAMFGLPFIVYLGALCGLKLRRATAAGRADIDAKKAAARFYKRYGRGGLAAGELLELIRDYLNNRFGLSYGSLTPPEAAQILKTRGVGVDTAEKLENWMRHCENAVYSGKGDEVVRTDEDLVKLIKKIEKESR